MDELSILEDIIFITLYGGVLVLNLVAALYLLLRRANAIAPGVTSPVRLRRWAAAFFLASTLSHVLWLLLACHPSQAGYVAVCSADILTIIPAIAGILLAMLQDRPRPVWPVAVSLVPALVLLALSVVCGNDTLLVVGSFYIVALYALLLLYMFFAVRRYGRWLRDNYADLEDKEIGQSFLFLVMFLLFFVMYGSTTGANEFLVYLFQINNILIVGLLLWRAETLQELTPDLQPEEKVQPGPVPASAPPTIPANIGPLLKKRCEDGQLYLQHDLNLAHLAQTIGTNRYYLSQYFAQQGLTYNAYINGLRIRHFIRLYHEAAAEQRIFTAQQLAYESGFHSYSTFSSSFKQAMGMTVTAWIRGLTD